MDTLVGIAWLRQKSHEVLQVFPGLGKNDTFEQLKG